MSDSSFKPYVPEEQGAKMKEFTFRALLLGLLMTVVLGAVNAYLGLRAGMTIAATYPAAVIGMAVLKILKGSILEENIARTVGSIGESVAAGAIFTIPAFAILGLWKFEAPSVRLGEAPLQYIKEIVTSPDYVQTSALMIVGGVLGILFVTLLRRIMVEDKDLPFPESVAAGEIHKAGRGEGAGTLFTAMGIGALVYLMGVVNIFKATKEWVLGVGEMGKSFIRMGPSQEAGTVGAGGVTVVSSPGIFPAYLGIGYIIGPELAALNFAGGVVSWGLLVPLIMYLLGPGLLENFAEIPRLASGEVNWSDTAYAVWGYIVRPIAVGGMLVGAAYTLWNMRKNLGIGMKRAVSDLKKAAGEHEATSRLDRDINFKLVFLGLAVTVVLMFLLYWFFTGQIGGALMAALVMAVAGFFFAAVSGNLVGLIGSSNNPVSGLTLSTLIVAALLMWLIGMQGDAGVAAVLGVAAVVCCSSAVAGEMLQDLKVGHILGGTPWRMQSGNLIGAVVAGAVMFIPLLVLHVANQIQGGIGFGDKELPAPQAGLMGLLAQGIIGGEMAWPLVIVGMLMGVALIMVRVKSPMLFAVGMYLPLMTTGAIFVGGLIRWACDKWGAKRGHNESQNARVVKTGILVAAGLISGEGLMGLIEKGYVFVTAGAKSIPAFSWTPPLLISLVVLAALALYLIVYPIRKAGSPDEPAPPSVMM
jgi:putative OPT family oligopeptide transporter